MKIIIENSGYKLKNIGDTAMLQVAVRRIFEHFPDAKVFVLTTAPKELKGYCPGAIPLSPAYRLARVFPLPLRFVPERLRIWVKRLEQSLKTNCPNMAYQCVNLLQAFTADNGNTDYFDHINSANIVLASGGGYITDHFIGHANNAMDSLLLAHNLGKRIAMFGQGIGPLENRIGNKKARHLFPKLELLGLREGLLSLDYAKSFSIPNNRIKITGDDSIELVLETYDPNTTKDGIGINIRQADYAGDMRHLMPKLAQVIDAFSVEENTELIPVPVSMYEPNSDLSSVGKIFKIKESENQKAKLIQSPVDLIKQINRCRVVITGSYHAGVFALAQGIPVIALVGSDYYEAKFMGLAAQFGEGCEIFDLRSLKTFDNLCRSLIDYIQNQKHFEPLLIEKAKIQAAKSKNAWNQFLNHA